MTHAQDADAALAIDVVICTNRVTPYLRTAVDSVLAQTHPSWRLTIVDDGSTSPEAIDAIASADERIAVIHQSNSGLPAARNTAIRATVGDVVAFLDDDDLWPPDRLTAQVALLHRTPATVAVFGDGRYIDAQGNVFGSWATADASSDDYLSGRADLPRITTLAVRRPAFAITGPFDPGFALAEDIEYILRLAQAGELRGTGHSVVDYRRHDRNMTNTSVLEQRDAVLRAVSSNITAARARGAHRQARLLTELLRRQRRGWSRDALRRSLHDWRGGDRARARDDLLSSLRLAPLAVVSGAVAGVGRKVLRRASTPVGGRA